MYLYPVEIKEAKPGHCVYILYLPHIALYFSNYIRKINTHCKEFGKCREVGKKFTTKCHLCMSLCFFLWHTLASLLAQMVKNLPAMQETWVRSRVGKIPCRRRWQPTPVLLPGESHGQRSLTGYSPGSCKESDMTEQLTLSLHIHLNICDCITYTHCLGLAAKVYSGVNMWKLIIPVMCPMGAGEETRDKHVWPKEPLIRVP